MIHIYQNETTDRGRSKWNTFRNLHWKFETAQKQP